VNPYTGEVVLEFDSIEEFANRELICAVAPDAPVGGFVG
jgi:hypothetical protein